MPNSEYLLIQMFKQTEGEILIMFDHLNIDEPVDSGVPDDFQFGGEQ